MTLFPRSPLFAAACLILVAAGLTTLAPQPATASGPITLADDVAVALDGNGVLYRVDLADATLTPGPTSTGVGVVGAIEANPTTGKILALEVDSLGVAIAGRALTLSPDDGAVTVLKDNYPAGQEFFALTRTPTGGHIAAYTTGGGVAEVASLASDGTLSSNQPVTLGGVGASVGALVYPSDGLFVFTDSDKENIYPLDAATGALGPALRLQEENAGSLRHFTAPHTIIAADSTSDDTVYFLTSDGFKATLYRLELVTNSPTVAIVEEVGVLTISGTTTTPDIGALAIATLLDDERPGDDPPGSNSSGSGRVDQAVAEPATSHDALAPTGVAGAGLVTAGAVALVIGVTLVVRFRRTRIWPGA